MMKVILAVFLLSCVSGQVSIGSQWKEVKSPLDSPRYHEIMKEIFPTISGRNLRGGRIAGGDFAQLGQFPFQALLMSMDALDDTYLCGGSLISFNWILTAAHCLDSIVQTSVYLGVIDRIKGPAVYGVTVRDKSNLIMHETYKSETVLNDIGVIRVPEVEGGRYELGRISLPIRAEVSASLEEKIATIAGFGQYTDVLPSEQLRFVDAKIVANSVCEEIYGRRFVLYTNICLQGTGGKSSCQGDSGGGLHLEMNGRKVVVGIVSFGSRAGCTLNYPVVYTKVSSYLDWIQKTTGIIIY